MKEKIIKWMASFLLMMLFCTLVARGAASLTVAKVRTDEPGRGTLTRHFQGTGMIVLSDRQFQSIPEGQKVARVLAVPGSDVKKGDKIIQFDLDYLDEQIKLQEREIEMKQLSLKQQELSGRPEARVSAAAQAKQELDAAEDALKKAKKKQKAEKTKANKAKAEKAKEEKAKEEKPIEEEGAEKQEGEEKETETGTEALNAAGEELEAARQAYKQAQNAYKLAAQEEKNVQKNENTRSQISGLEQKSIKLEIEGMTEQLDKLKEIRKAKGIVKAKKGGVLSSTGVSEGVITTGTEQIIIECGELEAQAFLPQEELGNVTEGDEVSLRIQGETRETVVKIERIGKENKSQGMTGQGDGSQDISGQGEASLQTFWYGRIEKDSLRPGTTFTYEYSKKSEGNYDRLIPLSALREAGGTAYVLIAQLRSGILGEDYEAVKVPVTVLEKDQDHAAVEGSFPEGALVIAESNKYVKEGDRVRLDE